MESQWWWIDESNNQTKQAILSLAYQLYAKNSISDLFSVEKEKAVVDWLKEFRMRLPDIALRSPQSAARARAFNKPVVDIFLVLIDDTRRVFNNDKMSLWTVPTKNTKLFAQAGRKQVVRVTSAEGGNWQLQLFVVSLLVYLYHPCLYFEDCEWRSNWWMVFDCLFMGAIQLIWWNSKLTWSRKNIGSRPFNYRCANLIYKKVECGIKNKTKSHHLQPLNVRVLYALEVYHNQELEKCRTNQPGRVVSVFEITKIFAAAFVKTAAPMNAIIGFWTWKCILRLKTLQNHYLY